MRLVSLNVSVSFAVRVSWSAGRCCARWWHHGGVPGVRLTAGADLQFPAGSLRISVGDDGVPVMDTVIPLLRTDMWPYWLTESVDAAVTARRAAQEVEAAASDGDDARIAQALEAELRSSMRAVSSAAFAVDAFYATVEARSHHPHRDTWREKRTPRHAQVFETIRYNLPSRAPGAVCHRLGMGRPPRRRRAGMASSRRPSDARARRAP